MSSRYVWSGPIERVVEQITVMFVMLGLWTALVAAGVGLAIMLRLDAIERKLDDKNAVRRPRSRLR